MTTQKDFKRLVRSRMQKTGESYTSARATLLKGSKRTAHAEGNGVSLTVAEPKPVVKAPSPADFAKLAGMSDEKIKEKTGCTWERWVWALDAVNAQAWPHGEIAEYVQREVQGAQLVDAGRHRRVRADPRSAGKGPAAQRQVGGVEEQDDRCGGRHGLQGVQAGEASSGLALQPGGGAHRRA
jgi:hypothetical protein